MENDGKGLADFSVTAEITKVPVMEKGVFKRILTPIKLVTHLFLSP